MQKQRLIIGDMVRRFYFAPKEAYSSDGCAVRELKDMVKACHKADIEVVLEMPFAAGISEQEAANALALLHDGVSCGQVCGQSLYRFMGTFK